MKDFYIQKGAEQRSYTSKQAEWLWQGHFPSGDSRICQADDLTSADQKISDQLV